MSEEDDQSDGMAIRCDMDSDDLENIESNAQDEQHQEDGVQRNVDIDNTLYADIEDDVDDDDYNDAFNDFMDDDGFGEEDDIRILPVAVDSSRLFHVSARINDDEDSDDVTSEDEDEDEDEEGNNLNGTVDSKDILSHDYVANLCNRDGAGDHVSQDISSESGIKPQITSFTNKACIFLLNEMIPMPSQRIPFVTSNPTIVTLLLELLGLRTKSDETALLPCLIGYHVTQSGEEELLYGCTISLEKAHFDESSYCLGVVFICDKRCTVVSYDISQTHSITGIVQVIDDETQSSLAQHSTSKHFPSMMRNSAFLTKLHDLNVEEVAIRILRKSNYFYKYPLILQSTMDDAEICRNLPTDTIDLSFFLCQQLLLSYEEERGLFNCERAEERMKTEDILAKDQAEVYCHCRRKLIQFKSNERLNLFGGNSVKAVFVNRFGVSFCVITTRKLLHFIPVTKPSLEDTWFPGYKWEILVCERCNEHIGWRFMTNEDIPLKIFYAVPLSAVRIQLHVCLTNK